MKSPRLILLSILATALLGIRQPLLCEVTIDPIGVAVYLDLEDNDSLTVAITLTNETEIDIAYDVRLSSDGLDLMDRDDLIGRFTGPNQVNEYCSPIGWDWDNERMWIITRDVTVAYTHDRAYREFEEVARINGGSYVDGAWAQGILFTATLGNRQLQRRDANGNQLGAVNLDHPIYAIAADVEEGWLFVMESENNYAIHVYELDGEGGVGDEIGVIDNHMAGHNNQAAYNLEWVPAHEDNGKLWINDRAGQRVWQIAVDEEEWECIDNENAVNFATGMNQMYDAVAHDGAYLWAAGYNLGDIRIYNDGYNELRIRDLMITSGEGIVDAERVAEIELLLTSNDAEAGSYHSSFRVYLSEVEEERRDEIPRFIKFAIILTIEEDVSTINGMITDAATEERLEGVRIDLAGYNYTRFSDEEGIYSLDDLPLGNYELKLTATDYLKQTVEITTEEAGEFELNIALRQAECIPNRELIEAVIESGESVDIPMEVHNNRNGPLSYHVEKRPLGEPEFEPWELRTHYAVEEMFEDQHAIGVVFIDGLYYVSGRHDEGDGSIVVFDLEWEIVDEFELRYENSNEIRGITWDGELIWGGWNGRLNGFSRLGELISTIEVHELRQFRYLTWDPDEEHFWTMTDGGLATGFDRDGNIVVEPFRAYGHGIGWYPEDSDGYHLYVFTSYDYGRQFAIWKYNTETGDRMMVADINDGDLYYPFGMCITDEIDPYSWVVAGIVDSDNDDGRYLGVWQLEERKEWLQIEPDEGMIDADSSVIFEVQLSTLDLPVDTFEMEIVFIHDGVGGETAIPVMMEVTNPEAVSNEGDNNPLEFRLFPAYPNPFNSSTLIRFSLPNTAKITLSAYDISGRRVIEILDTNLRSGRHETVWDASGLPSGQYFIRLTTPTQARVQKVVLLK